MAGSGIRQNSHDAKEFWRIPLPETQDALDNIKKAEKHLAMVAEQIKQLLKETKDATVLKKTLDQLKAAQQQLSEAKSSLGG